MNVYDVKVCQFISVEKKEKYEGILCLENSNFVTHYCMVDFSSFIAEDIFTGEQFRILQKNSAGLILKTENIEMNHNYAVYVNKIDFNQLAWRDVCRIKLACLRIKLMGKFLTSEKNNSKQNIIKR